MLMSRGSSCHPSFCTTKQHCSEGERGEIAKQGNISRGVPRLLACIIAGVELGHLKDKGCAPEIGHNDVGQTICTCAVLDYHWDGEFMNKSKNKQECT